MLNLMKEGKLITLQEFVSELEGWSFVYGIKSPDMGLYDFGFVKAEDAKSYDGNVDSCRYILHAMCRFKIIWRNGTSKVEKYYEDTPADVFREKVKRILGLPIHRSSLSEKNDLWLDLGECRIVFATYEEQEADSWVLFVRGLKGPFLAATDTSAYFIG